MRKLFAFVVLLTLSLSACGAPAPVPTETAVPPTVTPMPLESVVEAFMTALKDKDYAKVYELSSTTLQDSAGNATGFENWAKENDVYPLSWTPGEVTVTDGEATLVLTVDWEDQSGIPMRLTLINENGQWRIYNVAFDNP